VKYKVIELPLFDIFLHVYIIKDVLNLAIQLVAYHSLDVDMFQYPELDGIVIPLKDNGYILILAKLEPSIVAHECNHIMQYLTAGFGLTTEGKYPSYYIGYITQQIFDKKGYKEKTKI